MKTDRDALLNEIERLQTAGYDYLVKITGVDYISNVTVVYVLRNMSKDLDETLEVELEPSDAWVPTIIKQFSAADWYERELSEMFGVEIRGRRVRRLLLEKWDGAGAPLRKSFQWGHPYKSER